MKTIIYWCRNDLRVHDNIILSSRLNSNQLLLPIYILDSRFSQSHHLGFDKIGELRKVFLAEKF